MTIPSRFRTSLLLSTAAAAGCLALGTPAPAAAQTSTTPTSVAQAPAQTTAHPKPHRKAHAKGHKTARPAKAAQSIPLTPGSPSGSVSAAPFGAPQNNATAAAAIQSSGASAAPTRDSAESVIVTGSILRNPNLSGANPVTHLSALDLQRRGITTVAQALQTVTANGSGNLPPNFTGNGAFASGASGVSLRGLTTDSTLVLIDGQRAAYYPLSDDGERNFVDTNSIPQSIVQSIDVQQDGGSATYGADAVAGVVNIITKKEVQGFDGGAEGGLTQRGDGGHQRLYATYGYGDLNRDNFNVWVSGEYQQDDLIRNSDRGFPFNTGDLDSINGSNGNPNGLDADGSFVGLNNGSVGGATRVAQVSPVTVNPDGSLTPAGSGLIQPINSALGCNGLTTHVVAGVGTVCEQNQVSDYKIIQPSDRRISSTIKATVNLGDNAQGYAMFTYSQNQVFFPETPNYITDHSSTGDANLINIALPVTLANGQLNPQNPFASQGYAAQIYYLFGDIIPTETDFNQVFRGSSGINGTVLSHWGGDWHYNVGFVGMVDSLRRTLTGDETFQSILNAVNTGSYNFMDPSQNTQAERSAIAPTDVTTATSQEYALDVIVSKGLFDLPGGTTTLGIGGSARYESLNDPSANLDDPSNPNAQYLRDVNPFSAFGQRKVGSTFFELGVPVIKQFTVDVSGRYDNYSEGFDNFAPKVGVIVKPIPELTLRGTYSKGFRVPSFAETGGTNYGYVTSPPLPDSFLAMHQNAAGTGPDAYATAPAFALNTVGNPNLKPEHSDNFTGGVIVQPKPWLSVSADYYYIKKKDYVVTSDFSGPLADYYAGLNPAGVFASDARSRASHGDAGSQHDRRHLHQRGQPGDGRLRPAAHSQPATSHPLPAGRQVDQQRHRELRQPLQHHLSRCRHGAVCRHAGAIQRHLGVRHAALARELAQHLHLQEADRGDRHLLHQRLPHDRRGHHRPRQRRQLRQRAGRLRRRAHALRRQQLLGRGHDLRLRADQDGPCLHQHLQRRRLPPALRHRHLRRLPVQPVLGIGRHPGSRLPLRHHQQVLNAGQPSPGSRSRGTLMS